jgi:hypothetical protein
MIISGDTEANVHSWDLPIIAPSLFLISAVFLFPLRVGTTPVRGELRLAQKSNLSL